MTRRRRAAFLTGLVTAVILFTACLVPAIAQRAGDEEWGLKQGSNALPYLIFITATLSVVYLLFRGHKRG